MLVLFLHGGWARASSEIQPGASGRRLELVLGCDGVGIGLGWYLWEFANILDSRGRGFYHNWYARYVAL